MILQTISDTLMKSKKLEILKLCGFKWPFKNHCFGKVPETSVLSSGENSI